jgi:Toprim domain
MTAGIGADRLSLTELERHDPGAPRGSGRERRFLCPFPACADKQHPQRHRSLAVNVETGAYYCHRCQARGSLGDPSFQRPFQFAPPHQRLRQAFAVQHRPTSTTEPLGDADRVGIPIGDAPEALAYVGGRGILADLAIEAGLRFCATWSAAAGADHQGWPAVVFPMRDLDGVFLAAHGRAVRGPRKLTRGPTSSTVFATPGALAASTFAITEGPMDALSLALCGLPAVAMIGTNPPTWLCRHTFNHRVLVATDTDAAGDEAAARVIQGCASYGGTLIRLRPPAGTNDWNDALQRFGRDVLGILVELRVLPVADALTASADPRGDLVEDSACWIDLLGLSRRLDGENPDGLHAALHGARCCGVRVMESASGLRLVAGEMGEGYGPFRDQYLATHGPALRALLLEASSRVAVTKES